MCLKGQNVTAEKWNIVQCLANLLSLQVQHILISNSTDTAELLGSFEQVNEQQQDSSVAPVFKYVDSRLVKLLNHPNTLVYVEVFADYMVERLEKGISSIYDQKSRVIVGCDGIKLQTEMAQFLYLKVPSIIQEPPILTEAMLSCRATPYFSRPNLTSFEALSEQLNVDNPQEWLTRLTAQLELEIKNSKIRKGEALLRKKASVENNQTEKLESLYYSARQILLEVEAEREQDLLH